MCERWGEHHKAHGAEPGCFDKGPDEEEVEVEVFAAGISFGGAELDPLDF